MEPAPVSETPRLWTVDEFARLWGRSTKTVRRWIREGKVDVVRLGGTVRIPNSEVERLTNAHPPEDDDDPGTVVGDELIPTSPGLSRMLTGAR